MTSDDACDGYHSIHGQTALEVGTSGGSGRLGRQRLSNDHAGAARTAHKYEFFAAQPPLRTRIVTTQLFCWLLHVAMDTTVTVRLLRTGRDAVTIRAAYITPAAICRMYSVSV